MRDDWEDDDEDENDLVDSVEELNDTLSTSSSPKQVQILPEDNEDNKKIWQTACVHAPILVSYHPLTLKLD